MSQLQKDCVIVESPQKEKELHHEKDVLGSTHKISGPSELHHTQKKSNDSENKTEVKVDIDNSKLVEKKMSIFSQKKENENVTDIFAHKKSVNLLNINQSNANSVDKCMFKMASSSKPSVRSQEDEELSQISSEDIQEDKIGEAPPEPTERIMKYEYEQRTDKVGEFKLIKFKNGQSLAKEGLVLHLERSKDLASQILYFIVRNQATKINIFEGILLPNTKLEHFMEREENWKLWVVHQKKDKEGKAVNERESVKLQFENAEQAKEFQKIVTEPISKKLE